jgi:hypothetical protein
MMLFRNSKFVWYEGGMTFSNVYEVTWGKKEQEQAQQS